MGVVANADFASDEMMRRHRSMGSPSVRAEWAVETDPARLDGVFSKFAAQGIRPLVLAGFQDRFPARAAIRRFCSGIAARFGPGGSMDLPRAAAVRHIELGNETSYPYQTATYGEPERYAELVQTCAGAVRQGNPRVGVLAQGDDPASVGWVARMHRAVPELGGLVAGWTSHPYGPPSRGEALLDRVRDQTAAMGSAAPIFVTEWGLASDNRRCLSNNYGWTRCMTPGQARDALVQTVRRWRDKYPRLRAIYYYQTKDQRRSGSSAEGEHYFGLTRHDGAPKQPLYDAFKDLVAAGGS